MFKIENVTADIKLHDQPIAKRFINGSNAIKTKGIILQKPFKLQITAISKVGAAKKKRVRSIEFNGTLKEAVDAALRMRSDWKEELKGEIKSPLQNQPIAITEMITLSQAWDLYTKSKITEYATKNFVYDNYRYQKLFDKHVRPVLGNTLLDLIDSEDIQAITNKMTVRRAKIPKTPTGENYPNGKPKYEMEIRAATERTKRTIYQLISPIYTYVNGANKIKFNVPNPAGMKHLEPLENDKEVTVGIEAFTKLYNYDHPVYRKVFIWLMHGRRFNEVATLTYEDINDDTYTIRKENNKARVPMTYKLTKWQCDTLEEGGTGLVFPSVNNRNKTLNSSTVAAHFDLPCTMHDLRHVIGNTLVSKGVSIEIIGRILGHKPAKNIITNRYAKVDSFVADEALRSILEGVLK